MSKREQIERMLVDDPSDAFLNYALAMTLKTEGRLDEAVAQFRRLLEMDADHVPGHFQLGQTLAQAGDVEGARDVLRAGIAHAARAGDLHAEAEMTAFLDSL